MSNYMSPKPSISLLIFVSSSLLSLIIIPSKRTSFFLFFYVTSITSLCHLNSSFSLLILVSSPIFSHYHTFQTYLLLPSTHSLFLTSVASRVSVCHLNLPSPYSSLFYSPFSPIIIPSRRSSFYL